MSISTKAQPRSGNSAKDKELDFANSLLRLIKVAESRGLDRQRIGRVISAAAKALEQG